MRFEWDSQKDAENRHKHGVSFDEAATVFADPLAVIFDDEIHSVGERREILIGHSVVSRLLLVCFTERAGDVPRIYSARPATKAERIRYERYSRDRRA